MAAAAQAIPTGLHAGSSMQDAANIIDLMNGIITALQAELATQRATKPEKEKKKNLIDNKSISQVPYFNGDENGFADFDFKL